MLNYITLRNDRDWTKDPFYSFESIGEKIFDDLSNFKNRNYKENFSDWIPSCDLKEDEKNYTISLEVAGTPEENIKIESHDNKIIISGERHDDRQNKKNKNWYSEHHFGKFYRVFTLPPGADPNEIKAHYEHGILEVFVPKKSTIENKKIVIEPKHKKDKVIEPLSM